MDGALSQALQEPILLCDGGVVANNPSAEAVTFTSLAYGTENNPLPLKVSPWGVQARKLPCRAVC